MSAPIQAVVNASPLIFLARIGQLERLPNGVATTPTVVDEVTSGDPIDHPEVPLLDAWLGQKRCQVIEPEAGPPSRLSGLHEGEASVLALAIDEDASQVVIDDKAAIRAAKLFGLEPVSTPFLLVRACRNGDLSPATFERCLQRLLDHRYFFSPSLYQRLLSKAGVDEPSL